MRTYLEVFPDSGVDGPMRLAVAHAMVDMARLGKKHQEKITFWFEDGPFHGLIHNTFRELKVLESWRWDERGTLFGISFDDKELVPLQAADLVAREGFKIAANYGKRPLRKPVLGFWNRMGMGWYKKEALELLKEREWPHSLHAVVSLPDECYTNEKVNDGSQYYSIPPRQLTEKRDWLTK